MGISSEDTEIGDERKVTHLERERERERGEERDAIVKLIERKLDKFN